MWEDGCNFEWWNNTTSNFQIYRTPEYVAIVEEIGEGGDLLNYIRSKSCKFLTEDEMRPLFQQMITAIAYLEEEHIVHRLDGLIRWLKHTKFDFSGTSSVRTFSWTSREGRLNLEVHILESTMPVFKNFVIFRLWLHPRTSSWTIQHNSLWIKALCCTWIADWPALQWECNWYLECGRGVICVADRLVFWLKIINFACFLYRLLPLWWRRWQRGSNSQAATNTHN